MLVADPIDGGSLDPAGAGSPEPTAGQLLRLAAADAGSLREGLVDLVVRAGLQPGSTWLALVLGTRDEVGYAVELCGSAPDPIAPRCPPGFRAGALLTLPGDDHAVLRLVEGLAAGRHRLTLLLMGPGGDLEAARALVLVGEPERAGARSRLRLLACAGQPEAVLALPHGAPAPSGLPGRGSRGVPPPQWLAGPPAPRRRTLRRPRTPAGAGRHTAIAGLPRPLAAAGAAALLASFVLTGVVVARHAGDRGPLAAVAPSPSASAPDEPFGQGNFVEPGSGFPLARGPYQVPAGIAPGAPAPLARIGAASAVDQASGRLVLFGGAGTFGGNGGVLLSDTWERGLSGWLVSRSAISPPAARDDVMGWDPVGQRLLLVTQGSPSTWAYSGGAWTQLHPAHVPAACPGSMAVDPARGRLDLLLTCVGVRGVAPAELWSWSGTDWQRQAVSGAPAPPSPAMLVVDPGARTLLMAAAFSAAAGGPLELWRLTGSAWVPTGHSPAGWGPLGDTGPPILLSDPADHLVVSAQTAGGSWAWDGSTWGRPATQATGNAGPDWVAGWGNDSSGHLLVAGGTLSSSDTSEEWTFDAGGWARVMSLVIG